MESGCGESKPKIDGAQWSIYAQPGWLARLSEKRRREQPDVPGGRAKMDNLSCSTRRAGLRPIGARAGFCNRTEVWTILTAGVFCACSPLRFKLILIRVRASASSPAQAINLSVSWN